MLTASRGNRNRKQLQWFRITCNMNYNDIWVYTHRMLFMKLGTNFRKTWIEGTHFGYTVPCGSEMGHNMKVENQPKCVAWNTVTTSWKWKTISYWTRNWKWHTKLGVQSTIFLSISPKENDLYTPKTPSRKLKDSNESPIRQILVKIRLWRS
jgi:hypothetical protein